MRSFRRLLTCAVIVWLSASAAAADEAKARLANGRAAHALTFSPLALSGGSRLTLVSPARWAHLLQKLSGSLEAVHQRYTGIFGPIPPLKTSIRLMDEEDFFRTTKAPRWTNALYYREEIIIPLSEKGNLDWDNVLRAVSHEYTHAVVHALSKGRCPGWLDEGLAQWAEGIENPALRPALLKRLRGRGPLPLKILQGGFTKLDLEIVPAAYAQSLYVTQDIIATHGFEPIKIFLGALREGDSSGEAFKSAFNQTESAFERNLGEYLRRWAAADSPRQRKIVSEHAEALIDISGQRASGLTLGR